MDDVVKWCLDSHDGPSAVARVTILEDVAWTVCYEVLLVCMDMDYTWTIHCISGSYNFGVNTDQHANMKYLWTPAQDFLSFLTTEGIWTLPSYLMYLFVSSIAAPIMWLGFGVIFWSSLLQILAGQVVSAAGPPDSDSSWLQILLEEAPQMLALAPNLVSMKFGRATLVHI